ncbi:MAG: lysozyme [Pseudomonadota bacterium]
MQTNEEGVNLIKTFEGLELEAYEDIAGILTIGYGHTSVAGPPRVEEGMRIDEPEAEAILRKDLKKFERGVEQAVKVDVNPNEFSALVSFAFNVGLGALKSSTALKRLNKGERLGAADALMWWNKATVNGRKQEVAGLTRRRAAERALFLKPHDQVPAPKSDPIEENTRIQAEEGGPRRENLLESRTIQGAGVAGAAGVGAAALGQDQAREMNEMRAAEEAGEPLPAPEPEEPLVPLPGGTEPRGAEDAAEPAAPTPANEMTEEVIVDPAPSVDMEEVFNDIYVQLYVAFGVIIFFAVLYIIFARTDDWRKGKR